MISTKELFKLIEKYIFAFPSKEDLIKVVFNDDIESFTKMKEEDIEKIINKNLSNYFKTLFENEELPKIVKEYIEKQGKALSKKDMVFLDNIVINSNYELTFEDIEKLLEIKELSVYLKASKNDETSIVESIKEFQEIQELEKEEDDVRPRNYEYDGEDIEEKYYSDISKYELLTAEEERYYIKKYQEEDDPIAFDILVGSNQGLCKKVAKMYKNRGLSLLDLIQEGNIGLMKALKKFNLNKKNKLSTYATWWIRQTIKRALYYDSREIRIPMHICEKQEKLNKIKAAFLMNNNREATMEELVELTGFSLETLKHIEKYDIKMSSLDKPVLNGEDDASVLGDFIKSDVQSPEETADKQAEHDVFDMLLTRLGNDKTITTAKKFEQVLRLRMGIELYNEETYKIIRTNKLELKNRYTFVEISKIYGVTHQRIEQIEKKAIRRIKRYVEIDNIDIFENEYLKERKKQKIKELNEANEVKEEE